MNDIIINMIKLVTIQREMQALIEMRHKQYKIEEEKRWEQERLTQIHKARIQKLAEETDRMVKFNQIKNYIEIVSAEGKQRLGEAYPDSDFSKWVE